MTNERRITRASIKKASKVKAPDSDALVAVVINRPDGTFAAMDGQHRVSALKYLIREN